MDPFSAEEFLSQLMPIFESLRQKEEIPCSYPLAMGTRSGGPTYHWINRTHCHEASGVAILLVPGPNMVPELFPIFIYLFFKPLVCLFVCLFEFFFLVEFFCFSTLVYISSLPISACDLRVQHGPCLCLGCQLLFVCYLFL